MTQVPSTPWIQCPRRIADPRVRLFCFPHAGGGAATFRAWGSGLPDDIEVCAIQLPGRIGRLSEPPAISLAEVTVALLEALRPFQETPFAFFGHSVGALISFELARNLKRMHVHPVHLFVSGRAAPQLPYSRRLLNQLPASEFIEAVCQRYQGIPPEILNSPDVLELLLPALRADIAINETYQYSRARILDCPISAFGGLQDPSTSREELASWQFETTGPFRLRSFPGEHFFIHNAREALLRAIAEDLDRALRQADSSFVIG
jgi:medium-chain acyl-[acyl-carrier-protein] hydrolase